MHGVLGGGLRWVHGCKGADVHFAGSHRLLSSSSIAGLPVVAACLRMRTVYEELCVEEPLRESALNRAHA